MGTRLSGLPPNQSLERTRSAPAARLRRLGIVARRSAPGPLGDKAHSVATSDPPLSASWLPRSPAVVAAAATLTAWLALVLVRIPAASQFLVFAWPYVLMLGLQHWYEPFTLASWLLSISLTACATTAVLSVAHRFWRGRSVALGVAAAFAGMLLATTIVQGIFMQGE